VGFLFEEVADNGDYNEDADDILMLFATDPQMDEVWRNATGSATLSFAITDLVDADDFMQNYYHYWGSLTTPPCTPAVSWHLAQNTVKVRHSTMERFRNLTALWTYSGGIVDATTNYRPIQSNPSCISQCASSVKGEEYEYFEYCPGGKKAKKNNEFVIPVAVGVGVAVGLLLVGVAGYILKMYLKEKKHRRNVQKRKAAKFKKLQSESATNVLPAVNEKEDGDEQTELFVKKNKKHHDEEEDDHKE